MTRIRHIADTGHERKKQEEQENHESTLLWRSHYYDGERDGYPGSGREIIRQNPERNHTYVNRFKMGGYKMVLDGSPQGRSAWMSKPYLNGEQNGDSEYCGYPWLTDEEAQQYARQ